MRWSSPLVKGGRDPNCVSKSPPVFLHLPLPLISSPASAPMLHLPLPLISSPASAPILHLPLPLCFTCLCPGSCPLPHLRSLSPPLFPLFLFPCLYPLFPFYIIFLPLNPPPSPSPQVLSDEDVIADNESVILYTQKGYLLRTPAHSFTQQARGGKGEGGWGAHQHTASRRRLGAGRVCAPEPVHPWTPGLLDSWTPGPLSSLPLPPFQASTYPCLPYPYPPFQASTYPCLSYPYPPFQASTYLCLSYPCPPFQASSLSPYARVTRWWRQCPCMTTTHSYCAAQRGGRSGE